MNYLSNLSNCSFSFGLEGLAASASTTIPLGSININLGIELIPKAFKKSDSQFLSAYN
jgi:hypothetical protein